MEFARLDIFSKVQCQTSTKVMLTITDGYASDIVTPIGSELRDMGVIMLAIGKTSCYVMDRVRRPH